MRYPLINRQPAREINIPKFSGGINLRDSLTGIRDNQLTDSINMWYKDGMLKTRPPFVTNNASFKKIKQSAIYEEVTAQFHNEIRVVYKEYNCVCASSKYVFKDFEGQSKCKIDFEFQSTDKIFGLPAIDNIAGGEEIKYFVVNTEGILYCYISNFSIWKLEFNKKTEFDSEELIWQNVPLEESYIPTVMTHCKANGGKFEGVQLDSFNAITNSYRMVYSTVNKKAVVDGKVNMEYPLITIDSLKSYKNTKFRVKHTLANGVTNTHTIVCDIDGDSGTCYEYPVITPIDTFYMYVKINKNKATIGFSKTKGNNVASKLSESEFLEDNLEIDVIIPNNENLELKKIFGMQKNVWFGGASNGIYSGSRLFLGANSYSENQSLVVWSALNNPLYFPENCYAYVGNKLDAVSCFGRQNDKLIIFKEKEIYYTYYSYNDGINADDVINQTVVDYQANAVTFPMILLNTFVGCDCPNSVQMCRNRLVWANSKGAVYTLCKTNQYDEHTVYEISEMVGVKLKTYKDKLKNSTSADFAGHYILFLEDCAFVADYNSYGYQYIYSYSKTDDANALLPWYYWDFSFLKKNETENGYHSACVCALDESLLMRTYYNASDNLKSGTVGFVMRENEYLPADKIFDNDFYRRNLEISDCTINSSVSTKMFELGGGIYNINVDSLVLKTGSNNGAHISVEILSEKGKEKSVIASKREYKSDTDCDYIKPKRIYPCMRAILKLGLKIECDGLLAIDGLALQYRLLGGAK